MYRPKTGMPRAPGADALRCGTAPDVEGGASDGTGTSRRDHRIESED